MSDQDESFQPSPLSLPSSSFASPDRAGYSAQPRSNILDPSFWNNVKPLPVVAVKSAAMLDDEMPMAMGSEFARGGAPAGAGAVAATDMSLIDLGEAVYPPTVDSSPPFQHMLEPPPSMRRSSSMFDLDRYDNYDRTDPLLPTARDVAYSAAMRARQHPEPILPDLPPPPVVLG